MGFGEEADDVDHANLTDAGAAALELFLGFNLRLLFSNERVVTVPDADVGVVDPLQGGEGVGYGVADGEGPERRFPKTQIGQFMPRQSSCCHKLSKFEERERKRITREREGEV